MEGCVQVLLGEICQAIKCHAGIIPLPFKAVQTQLNCKVCAVAEPVWKTLVS